MNALLITYYKYPDGDAGSIRQASFAKMLAMLGYDATIIGMGDNTNYQIKIHNGIKYVSLRGNESNKLEKTKNYFLYKKHLIRFLTGQAPPQVILVNDVPINALQYIKKYAKQHNARLIHDSVEWYSPEEFKHGRFSFQYIMKDRLNRYWIDRDFSVIAISRYLEKHFMSRGILAVRIPSVLDIEKIPFEKITSGKKIIFMYAGAPGKKDFLNLIVAGFALIDKEICKNLELRIIGVNKHQLIADCDVNQNDIEKLGESLVLIGRVSHNEVLKTLSVANYTVLLRPESQRYALAGFPTKIVESLASATPVICNITSDLADYLIDGQNSLIIENCNAEKLAETVERALALNDHQIYLMQKAARQSAKEKFDYSQYLNELKVLL